MIVRPITIAIVEDEPGHARLALKCFSKMESVTCLTFSTGRSALSYLNERSTQDLRSHVVVLDLNMPGMDGHQVLDKIKKDIKTRLTPVIVLSSTDSEDEIRRCYYSGANLYLVKQLDFQEYKNTLSNICTFVEMYRRT